MLPKIAAQEEKERSISEEHGCEFLLNVYLISKAFLLPCLIWSDEF